VTEGLGPDAAGRTEELSRASAGNEISSDNAAKCDQMTSVEAFDTLRASVAAYNGVEHARMADHRQAIWDLLLQ